MLSLSLTTSQYLDLKREKVIRRWFFCQSPPRQMLDVVIVCSRQCYALSRLMPSTLWHRPQLRSAQVHGVTALTWSPPHCSALANTGPALARQYMRSIMTRLGLSMTLTKTRHYIRNIWGPTQWYIRSLHCQVALHIFYRNRPYFASFDPLIFNI